MLAQDFRVEERFGFDGHLPEERIRRRRQETKGNEHPTSNIQQPTSNAGSRHGMKAECRMKNAEGHPKPCPGLWRSYNKGYSAA